MYADLLNWYEANLPPHERKRRGHFSTPPQLVEQILDACGYVPYTDLSRLRVLDPSCGSGNFLVAVARRLVASCELCGSDEAGTRELVRRNLWGFDPDPVACFLAEMRLQAVLAQHNRPGENAAPGPQHLHIHQADGLALPWEQCENVDLFLANPPYLAAKNSDLSGYRSTHQRGQADSYLLFLDLALKVVRPGGWIGLVLPDPVLARANAARERQALLSQSTVHHLWHLSGVFEAYVGAVVIIAQKKVPPPSHAVAWVREKWRQQALCTARSVVAQEVLLKQPGAELRYLLSDQQEALVARLWASCCSSPARDAAERFAPLAQFVEIRRGEELGKATAFVAEHVPEAAGEHWLPLLRGGVDVRSYAVHSTGSYAIARDAVVKSLTRYLTPKLLVVKSTGLLQAALDLRGHVVLQTLYLLNWRGPATSQEVIDELYFLLALLNSRLLQDYVRILYTAYKWVQPQIEQHVLAQLPVPLVSYEQKAAIVQRAKLLMHACSTVSSVVELELYEEQERAIQALYATILGASVEV